MSVRAHAAPVRCRCEFEVAVAESGFAAVQGKRRVAVATEWRSSRGENRGNAPDRHFRCAAAGRAHRHLRATRQQYSLAARTY